MYIDFATVERAMPPKTVTFAMWRPTKNNRGEGRVNRLSMANFKNIAATTPEMIVAYVATGRPPTDAMLRAALLGLEKRPLPPRQWERLLGELDEQAPRRRGRPRRGMSITDWLADAIEALPDANLPPRFRDLLVHRLKTGTRVTEFDRARPLHRTVEKRKIALIYAAGFAEARRAVARKEPAHFPSICLTIHSPDPTAPAARQALQMTQTLGRILGLNPPSERTLHNMLSASKSLNQRR